MKPWSWTLIAAAAGLSACSGDKEAPNAYRALDCTQPFPTQVRLIAAQPGLAPAPKDPAEPYRFYSSGDGRTSYLITEKGAPGHPAVMMQQAMVGDVVTTGCPYGDQAAYEQLHAYLDGLKHWTRQ